MEYRELLIRYAECIGIDDKDSKTFRRFRQDYSDALVEIYGESPPTKVFRKQLAETEDIVETFGDSTLETNFAVNAGFTIASGKATTTVVGKLTVIELQKINSLQIKVSGTVTTPPATVFAAGTVKLYTELGAELFSGTFVLTNVNGAEETFDFAVAFELTNMYLEIEFTKGTQYTDVSLDEVTIGTDDNSFLLPSDFFIPLEVKFEQSSDRRMIYSNEMHRERFERWTPNKLIADSGEVTAVTNFDPILQTNENLDFDRGIGYFVDRQPEGVYLHFKPRIAGTFTMVYGFLPVAYVNIDEGDTVSFQRVFVDLILYNAVIRGYRKKMANSKSTSDGEVIVMRTLLSEYKTEYVKLLHRYTNYMKSNTESKQIYPFSFLADIDMELN